MAKVVDGGVVEALADPRQWVFGGLTGAPEGEEVKPDGDWRGSIPPFESQVWRDRLQGICSPFDCTARAATNGVEANAMARYGEVLDVSDWFVALASGNQRRVGNQSVAPLEFMRKGGWLTEEEFGRTAGITEDEYYLRKVTEPELAGAKGKLKVWIISHEYVNLTDEDLRKALKRAPLSVTIQAYTATDAMGRHVQGGPDARYNHQVLLTYIAEDGTRHVLDSIDRAERTFAPGYRFGVAILVRAWRVGGAEQVGLPAGFREGVRYFVTGGRGRTLFALGGHLRQDDLAKCLDQWIGRNDGQLAGKSATVDESALAGVRLYDLSGSKIN